MQSYLARSSIGASGLPKTIALKINPERPEFAALAGNRMEYGMLDLIPGMLGSVIRASGTLSCLPLLCPDDLRQRVDAGSKVVDLRPQETREGLDWDFGTVLLLEMESVRATQQALPDLARDPLVQFAYDIPERKTMQTPVDPLNVRQWGLNAVKWTTAVTKPNFPDASNVTIAIIDTGVDIDHPDLGAAVAEVFNYAGGKDKDLHGHGTHVAGCIAALSNNNIGISGLCQSKKLSIYKVFSPDNRAGYLQALAKLAGAPPRVINLSLGGTTNDPTEQMAIGKLIAAGSVIVAAMGNERKEGSPISYPAACPGVIAVGATDHVDRIMDESSQGNHISLTAPGSAIFSTVPTYHVNGTPDEEYGCLSGTSQAAPFVSGAAALLVAKNGALTTPDVKKILEDTADKVQGHTTFNTDYGHGRLNIDAALMVA